MNSVTAVSPVVHGELALWEVVAQPSTCMTPYELGYADAANGELCVPESYFARRDQMVAYAQGFEACAGPTLLSRQILRGVA